MMQGGYTFDMPKDIDPEIIRKARPGTRTLKHIRMPEWMEADLKAYAARESVTFNHAVIIHLKKGLDK
jgi:hypothetical protein